jgi:autotransporter-associated beta strand protein
LGATKFANNAGLTIGNNARLVLGTSTALGSGTTPSLNASLTVKAGGVFEMSESAGSVRSPFINSLAGDGTVINSGSTGSAGTLTISGTSGSTDFSGVITNGTNGGVIALTKSGASTQILSGSNTYTGATAVNAGTLRFGKSQTLSSLSVATTGTAQIASGAASHLDVQALTLTGSAVLDIANNALVIRAAAGLTGAQVGALINTGLNNGPNAYWDGPGINSSAAANDPNGATAVGFLDNSAWGYTNATGKDFTYDAGNLDGTSADILVKYSYYGDANLDGIVNGDDLGQFLFGKANPAQATWLNGDFNNDGAVNGDDLGLFLSGKAAYGTNGPLLAGGGGNGGGAAAVPEPGSVALLVAGAGAALGQMARNKRRPKQ